MRANFLLFRITAVGLFFSMVLARDSRAADLDPATKILTEMGAHPGQNWLLNREQLFALGSKAIPALRAYYKSPGAKDQVRSIALEAIYRSEKTDATRQELREACWKDADKQFRSACFMMLGRTKDSAFTEDYLKALANPTEEAGVQVMAAMGLAILGDRRGYNRAMQSVQKPDGYQDFGMMTLEILKAHEALPILEATLKGTTNYWVVNSCRQAILRINLVDKGPDEQIALLEQALRQDGYFEVRTWSSRKLAHIGTTEAGKTLSRIANDPGSPGRDAARTGLMIGVQEKHWTNEDIRHWE